MYMLTEEPSGPAPQKSQFPARLDGQHTAELLGFAPHDIPILVAGGLLRPLGRPAPNAPKYFALVDVCELAGDRAWLNKATKVVADHWAAKNAKQRSRGAIGTPDTVSKTVSKQ
jgi:hypothetical protein